jgi:hypothetical protein
MKTIPLTQGKTAFVDEWAYERLARLGKWQCVNGYAAKSVRGTQKLYMTRLILEWLGIDVDGLQVFHRDGNRLNNCAHNLIAAAKVTVLNEAA